jgi:putative ABC transport system permease protein
MFRHNFLITYRNFLCYKSSYFINLAGLSRGLACTLLIYLWVNDEVHIDKYHEKDADAVVFCNGGGHPFSLVHG